MNRIFSRIAAVAVILSLSLLAASPAQAAPLGSGQWISEMPVHWTDAALGWLTSFFYGDIQEKGSGNGGNGYDDGDDDWTVTPQTGSCIDPQGNPCVIDPEW